MTLAISVVVPSTGDTTLLARSLPPLVELNRSDFEIAVVANDAGGSVGEWARARFGSGVRVVDTGRDLGFAAAVNRGIEATVGELVLVLNDDVLLTRSYLSEIEKLFEAEPRAGCATGKILRYDLETDRETDAIDTTGLVIGRNRRAVDRGEGSRDAGQFDGEGPEQVFGVSGAAPVARRSALEDARVGDEYLDESFHMYKEDVDLSWRLRLLGWECWYVPTAVAFHGRTSRGAGGGYLRSPLAFHRAQQAKPSYVRMHSIKNQWLMLVKNEDARTLWRDLPFIACREAAVLLHTLVFNPRALAAVPEFFRALPAARDKRREIKRRQGVDAAELRSWFGREESST